MKYSIASLILGITLFPLTSFAATVSLTPLSQSEDCTTVTTIHVTGLQPDQSIAYFNPTGYYYNYETYGNLGEDDSEPIDGDFTHEMAFSIYPAQGACDDLTGGGIYSDLWNLAIMDETVDNGTGGDDCGGGLYSDCVAEGKVIEDHFFTIVPPDEEGGGGGEISLNAGFMNGTLENVLSSSSASVATAVDDNLTGIFVFFGILVSVGLMTILFKRLIGRM